MRRPSANGRRTMTEYRFPRRRQGPVKEVGQIVQSPKVEGGRIVAPPDHLPAFTTMLLRIASGLGIAALSVLLSGCSGAILHPAGDIALQQRNLIIASTVLMLLIIVPVMLLTAVFAWRYRESNTQATYTPEWNHSTTLEFVIWSAPLLIIIALGALTWITTHTLDPFRPLNRIDAARPLAADVKPVRIQVIALDWKWLFIYPDQGIATVNEAAVPVDVPVEFDITASSVMNAFAVPAVAGMIYAMPGMQTQLHAVVNREGRYEGFSGNYSGAGFSDMRFALLGKSQAGFDAWIAQAKADGTPLGRPEYLELEKPSEREPVRRYGTVASDLYDAILNRCVLPGKMCERDMMAIDAHGGLGFAGIGNLGRILHEPTWRFGHSEGSEDVAMSFVLALCATNTNSRTLTNSPAISLR